MTEPQANFRPPHSTLPLVKVKMTPGRWSVPQPEDGIPLVKVKNGPRGPQSEGACLPMSTSVPILPTQSAQITGQSTSVFKIRRLVISNAGTDGGSADWVVNAFKINDMSQFVESGNVSGYVFATNAPDNEIDKFVRTGQLLELDDDVVVVVTYIGTNERGCSFFGALFG